MIAQPQLRPSETHGHDRPLSVRRIGGLDIAVAEGPPMFEHLANRLDGHRFTPVAFANAHCVNMAADHAEYRRTMRDFTVLADGIGVDIASRVLYGEPFPANLNGTDFVPELLRRLPAGRRIALIGAEPGVAEEAAAVLRARLPRHDIRAISHGFFREGLETEIVLARLRRFSPDVTLVALGVPRQELFIARHLGLSETTIAIGVGALFDFLSGRLTRAPERWRALRMEWVFRLLTEPNRLWRRYVLGNPRFLLRLGRALVLEGRPPKRLAR